MKTRVFPVRFPTNGASDRKREDTLPWADEEDSGVIHLEQVTANYVVERIIGHGGNGVVEVAVQPNLGRRVAIKRLYKPNDKAAAKALLREAAITARLKHSAIVPIHQVLRDPVRGPVVIMRYVEGATWSSMRQDAVKHARVALELSLALEYAHQEGILHLDIKPDNVIVSGFGEISLIDWGIAYDLVSDTSRQILGTPAYMAPEMTSLDGAVDARTDVYLLGGALFEALYGHPPHGRSSEEASMLAAHEAVEFPNTKVPDELRALCQRCLNIDPQQRFESMSDVRLALENFLEHIDSERLTRRVMDEFEDQPTMVDFEVWRGWVTRLDAALELWPDNPRARAGRQRVLVELMSAHLDRGDLHAARAVATSVLHIPPRMRARFIALEQRYRENTTAHARLQELSTHYDSRTDARLRGRVMGMMLIVFLAVPLIGVIAEGSFSFNMLQLAGFSMVELLVFVSMLWSFGRRLRSTFINRLVADSLSIALGLAVVARLVAFWMGFSGHQLMFGGLIGLTGMLVSKWTVHPGFRSAGVLIGLLATLVAVFPNTAIIVDILAGPMFAAAFWLEARRGRSSVEGDSDHDLTWS